MHLAELNVDCFMQTGMLAKGEGGHVMTLLPNGFVPGPYDVICGRGKKIFNHVGNEHFRLMVAESLEEYSNSATKLEKSYILYDVVAQVRNNSSYGGFIKKNPKDGRWYEVGDFLAREKTSQAFRDALHDHYKSSNAAKKMRRHAEHGTITKTKTPRRAFSSSHLVFAKAKAVAKRPAETKSDALLAKFRNQKPSRSVLEVGGTSVA